LGGGDRQIKDQRQLGKSRRPYMKKQIKSKKAADVANVVESLSSNHRALSSIPSTAKKRNKRLYFEYHNRFQESQHQRDIETWSRDKSFQQQQHTKGLALPLPYTCISPHNIL
jgi:hypothetical protein